MIARKVIAEDGTVYIVIPKDVYKTGEKYAMEKFGDAVLIFPETGPRMVESL